MEEKINIKVVPIDPDKPGFLPRYRNMLSAKRSLMDFKSAKPEDIDGVYALLIEHISEPESEAEKRAALDKLSVTDLGAILKAVMGGGEVPPAKGAG